jgi:hypothetical protein
LRLLLQQYQWSRVSSEMLQTLVGMGLHSELSKSSGSNRIILTMYVPQTNQYADHKHLSNDIRKTLQILSRQMGLLGVGHITGARLTRLRTCPEFGCSDYWSCYCWLWFGWDCVGNTDVRNDTAFHLSLVCQGTCIWHRPVLWATVSPFASDPHIMGWSEASRILPVWLHHWLVAS